MGKTISPTAKIKSIKKTISKSELPDVDVDFGENLAGDGRHTIIHWLEEKFNNKKTGDVHVAAVGNRVVYSLKSAIRDVASVHEVPPSDTFGMTKYLDDTITIEANMRKNPRIKEYFDKYPIVRELAPKLVGVGSSLGVHAGGVIVSDSSYPINKFCGIQRTSDDALVATIFTKKEVEQLGFVKMDLLGVNAVTHIAQCKKMIGEEDLYSDYPVNKSVIKYIARHGLHRNIFQLESALGKKVLTETHPESINDIAVISAAIRVLGSEEGREAYDRYKEHKQYEQSAPGFWKNYLASVVKNKKNLKICEQELSTTYGVMFYQEQLSKMLVGFSNGVISFNDANIARKKMGDIVKKHGKLDSLFGDKEKLQNWHRDMIAILNEYALPFLGEDGPDSDNKDIQDFIAGKIVGQEGFYELPHLPDGILNWLVIGSNYLFSVIHATAYAITGYNQMHQKYYHPAEFWVSCLNSVVKRDKIPGIYSALLTESDLVLLPPCVNKSRVKCTIEEQDGKKCVRIGLSFLQGVIKEGDKIVTQRELHGEYKTFDDFLQRISINKTAIENLMHTNAFSCFGITPDEAHKYLLEADCRFSDTKFMFTDKAMNKRERDILGTNVSFVSKVEKEARDMFSVKDIADFSSAKIAFRVEKVMNKTTNKDKKPYRLLVGKCIKSKESQNIFCWDNEVKIAPGDYFFTVSRRGDFYSVSFPAPEKKYKR